MKTRAINIFWSVVLIGLGVIFLLRELGMVNFDYFSNAIWAVIFGVASTFFLLTYMLKGPQQWGWLFPATISAGIALVIGLEGSVLGSTLSGAPILAGIAVPFLAAYASDPKTRQWALIPAWVMAVLTLVVFIERHVSGNLIGALVLYSIGLPFLIVYLMDRNRRWALIPFAALSVVGTIPLLDIFISGRIFDVLIMCLLAAPFFVAFFWSKNNWWVLIPAGVFASIALTLLTEGVFSGAFQAGILLAGMGATFVALWLQRTTQPTDWAKLPAIGLFATAVLVTFLQNPTDLVGPIVLIVAGITVLISGILRKSQKKE